MKDTSWRTGALRIKSKTLARALINLVIAKEVKPNIPKPHKQKKERKKISRSGERNEVQKETEIFFSQFSD